MEFVGKKLLILAGAGVHSKVVRAAKEMGIYTIVTDNIEDSPAKLIADESWMYSITDVGAIVERCKIEHVDGVVNFCIDPGQRPYLRICNELGVPCYTNAAQLAVLTDKRKFKDYCIAHNVDVIPEYSIEDILNNNVEYPVFIKPDHGVGAEGTFKIEKPADIVDFFAKRDPNVTYICEQFVSGNIISFDGICDSKSNVVFCASNFFPPSIADIVHEQKDVFYFTYPHVPKDLEEMGRKVIKAFGVKQRFFHLEFFRLTKDCKGLGKVGDVVPLETNMRPAGGYTPDLINFANSSNVYQIYADVIAYDENRQKDEFPHYYAAVASRRDGVSYKLSDEELLNKYRNVICHHGRYAKIFSDAMGDRFFMVRFEKESDMNEFRDAAEERC